MKPPVEAPASRQRRPSTRGARPRRPSASSAPASLWHQDLEGLGRVDLTGGLGDDLAVEGNVTVGDERGGVGAGAGQPAAHEL